MSNDNSNNTKIDKTEDNQDESQGIHYVVVVIEAFVDEDQIEDDEDDDKDNDVCNYDLFAEVFLHFLLKLLNGL